MTHKALHKCQALLMVMVVMVVAVVGVMEKSFWNLLFSSQSLRD